MLVRRTQQQFSNPSMPMTSWCIGEVRQSHCPPLFTEVTAGVCASGMLLSRIKKWLKKKRGKGRSSMDEHLREYPHEGVPTWRRDSKKKINKPKESSYPYPLNYG